MGRVGNRYFGIHNPGCREFESRSVRYNIKINTETKMQIQINHDKKVYNVRKKFIKQLISDLSD